MNRPNFFCSLDALDFINGMEFEGDHKDIELTIDFIEIPLYFIFSADEETQTIKAMQRLTIYTHADSGVEAGCIVVDRKDGTYKTEGSLGENMTIFYAACLNISKYIQEKSLESVYAGFDPEEKGILLYVEDGELKHKVVVGKERPDLMFVTLFGGTAMGRPYMNDFMENSERDMMPFEEKLEAAEGGDDDCMELVANAYLNGDEVEQDYEKSFYWQKKRAEAGSAVGQFNTGLYYAKGCGVKRDLAKAAEWMHKAAESGDEDAPGTAALYETAAEDLQKAEAGDAAAQGRLAGFYMGTAGSLEQLGSDDDYKESLRWAKKAAKQGNGDGLWTLALAYEHGRWVTENAKTAVEYYKKGAEAGHARSLNSLGCYYLRGDVVEQNMKLGFELLLRSALLGDGEGMANLGRCYQYGNGCMGSMKKACVWYKKSLELIPNEELARKAMFFEAMPDLDEEYYGEDSDRKLTAAEQAFLDKIDAVLPVAVKA